MNNSIFVVPNDVGLITAYCQGGGGGGGAGIINIGAGLNGGGGGGGAGGDYTESSFIVIPGESLTITIGSGGAGGVGVDGSDGTDTLIERVGPTTLAIATGGGRGFKSTQITGGYGGNGGNGGFGGGGGRSWGQWTCR